MGVRNVLVEGVSGTGKTAVATELLRRGHHAIHGDRALAYQGDPATGEKLSGSVHEHHIWDVGKVRALVEDRSRPVTFFCGGSRNFHRFIHWFDTVFVLEVDRETLLARLAARPPGEFGADPREHALILRLHATQEDLPRHGWRIDATAPLAQVVDEILSRCAEVGRLGS